MTTIGRLLPILFGLLLAAAPSLGGGQAGPVVWRSLTIGYGHTCGLTADGVAYCWGSNDWGQLGDGTRRAKFVPVAVAARAALRFRSISAGAEHTCAVATDGTAWCWGDNKNGQLGDRTRNTRTRPSAVASRLRFRSMSASYESTCALAESGAAYCWGGLGTAPVAVAQGHRFGSLEVGDRICGLTADSTAMCWREVEGDSGPTAVPGGLRFARLIPGSNADCGVTADGAGWCWGSEVPGRPVNPAPSERTYEPFAPLPAQRLKSIGVQWRSACALVDDGAPWCWGEGGGVVTGVSEQEVSRERVRIPVGPPLASLTIGLHHACGLTADGVGYCWGANGAGQLGDGTDSTRQAAVRVAEPAAPGATDVAGGPEPVRRVRTAPSTLVIPRDYDPTRRYPVVVEFPATGGRVADGTGGVVRTDTSVEYVQLLAGDQGSEDDYITGEAWWETILRYDRGILEDLSSFAARYSLDTTRVVGMGFSLGGDLAWALSQRNPTRFIGAIVVGSRAGYRAPAANLRTMAERRARFVFALGESEDSGRILGAEAAMELLRRNGVEYRYVRIPRPGHVNAPVEAHREALAFILGPR